MCDVRLLPENEKRDYLPLLLDADPSLEMIEKYLSTSDMYVMLARSEVVCEAVIDPGETLELMNIATAPKHRNQGYAGAMIAHLHRIYAARYAEIAVGTSESGVGFYEKLGFRRAGLRPSFFPLNYPEPILEDGVQAIDMVVLKRPTGNETTGT